MSPGLTESPPVPAPFVVAVACAMAAAWLAAGSTGLLGHGLRHALTWVFTAVATIAAWPREGPRERRLPALAVALCIAVALTPAILPAVNVVGVLVVVAALALLSPRSCWRPLRVATGAVAIFTVYRLAVQAIPAVWMAADHVGRFAGYLAGVFTGHKLAVGATFGGVDFLVLSGSFYGLWLANGPAPRGRRAVYGGLAVLVAHFAYLAILSLAPAFLKDIPAATREQPSPVWVVPLPGFLDATLKLDAVAVRQFVPYNLPLLAVLFHGLAIAALVRWSAWKQDAPPFRARRTARGWLVPVAAAVAAALLPFVTTYCTPGRSLEGKKIVVSDRLFGNFMKPQYGDYGHLSIGMYGDLQPFVESLGGRAVVSSNLSDDDLKDADALVLIYPNKPFTDEPADRLLRLADQYLGWGVSRWAQQLQIDRIWRYVEDGGTLLVMGEHTTADESVPPPLRNYVNQVLAPSAIRLNFDSATFEIGGWLQSYQPLSHPITAGIEDGRNGFGVVIGASLDVKFPARPVLVGRWGWSDPGDEGAGASMMGNHHYDAGERLGDLILIAEQSYGKGRLVAFGDPSNVTNGITIGAHPFNARLYSYLTHNPAAAKGGAGDTPQGGWRQILGVLLAGALIVLLVKDAQPIPTAGVVLLMGLSLWFWNGRVAAAAEIYPDKAKMTSPEIYQEKGKRQPNYAGIAYIDDAHLGYFSEESWRPEGTMGLAMNLMRAGYLTLMAPDLSAERLAGASLLVIPAPTRPLADEEIATLQKWVNTGGTLIMTIGWDRYRRSEALVRAFGFDVGGADPNRPPDPLGHFKAPYIDLKTHKPYVRFHAAWPVRLLDPTELKRGDRRPIARVVAYGRDDDAVILLRDQGLGKVMLVGDSEFATNQNLEHEGGEPFEGMRENADFWRWLISYHIREEKDPWLPPAPNAASEKPKSPADDFELEGK